MKKLLIFVQYYEPAYKAGGPVRSIKAFVENLSSCYDITIITGDRDIGEKERFKLPINKMVFKDNYKIFYCTKGYILKNIIELTKSIEPDILYLNSHFSFYFSVYILLLKKFGFLSGKIKTIVAPRGELAYSALSLKGKIGKIKKLKKSIFLFGAKLINMYANVLFHATSDAEEKDIRKIYLNKNIKVFKAENFSLKYKKIDVNIRSSKVALKVIFLSRINKIKNLDYAIKIINDLKINIQFDIYGPKEDMDYWGQCENLIKETPNNIIVNYNGAIKGEDSVNVLNKYDILLLPTKGENFGHVIVESLAAGLVVLTSNNVPQDDLEINNCGFNISLNDESYYKRCLRKLSQDYNLIYNMKQNSREYYERHYLKVEDLKSKYLHNL